VVGLERVPSRRRENGRISVFKGRKAKLNHLIFRTLSLKGPQTIYDIHKILKTTRRKRQVRYSSLNKRVRSLEESGYIKKIGAKKTQAGFEAVIYDLTARAYLATLLNSINLNELVEQADETTATQILTDIALAELMKSKSKRWI
jgi:DNA-binding MarR family transcriptional regulator